MGMPGELCTVLFGGRGLCMSDYVHTLLCGLAKSNADKGCCYSVAR